MNPFLNDEYKNKARAINKSCTNIGQNLKLGFCKIRLYFKMLRYHHLILIRLLCLIKRQHKMTTIKLMITAEHIASCVWKIISTRGTTAFFK